ncbi:hypothetical protein AbraIFM66951_002473 [Aspergillus brasiliensis]|uniref:2EXR domain-containing protein n=1 Tax=Aspergillus brasiliensis TaxID=319629 RepID=A0A9W5YY87_9EURO|nr:hypothetical protein AbraCBS73388_001729 [Aspergillus brasiliensis]GKZ49767.1 hypothetical protein AbraIFM66951_002473 [Aspergillus brasiliensis]
MEPQFSIFSLLPPELRLLIWEHALPSPIQQGLCIYQVKRYFVSDETPYGFPLACLPTMRVEMPLFLVNHEAHVVACKWLRKQTGTFLSHLTQDEFYFTRSPHPTSDALYLPEDIFLRLLTEGLTAHNAAQYVGLNGQTRLPARLPAFRRLAIPRPLLEKFRWFIGAIFAMVTYPRFEEILVVEDVSEKVEDLIMLPGVQRPWEWAVVPGSETLVWDNSRRAFRREESQEGDPEADEFARFVAWASLNIHRVTTWHDGRLLWVRRVYTIMK